MLDANAKTNSEILAEIDQLKHFLERKEGMLLKAVYNALYKVIYLENEKKLSLELSNKEKEIEKLKLSLKGL